ncbi:MAG: hypothetical protein JWP97_5936 [Labilithrix sp.]|nr:hypothetical protein [Labilithrix sp.]
MSMDQLEAVVNEVSDKDWAWWPFLWMRPEKHGHLSVVRVAAMAMLYGLPASVLTELGIKLQYAASAAEIAGTALFFPVLFLLVGTVFVAPMWNRRAASLRSRRAAGCGA